MQPSRRNRLPLAGRRDFLKGSAALSAMLLAAGPISAGEAAAQGGSRVLSAAFAAMGADLYEALGSKPGNLVLSPYSIGTAMAMTLSGARGATGAELAKVLHLRLNREEMEDACAEVTATLKAYDRTSDPRFCPDGARWTGKICETGSDGDKCKYPFQPDNGRCAASPRLPHVQLLDANALMLTEAGRPVSDEYRALVQQRYAAELFLNATPGMVNGWVKDKTNGKIEKILDTIGKDAVLVLLNAVYFKAAWQAPFNKAATQPRSFHLPAGQSIEIPAMYRVGKYKLVARPGFRALSIPYAQDALSMTIVLPDSVSGLPAVESALRGEETASLLYSIQPEALSRIALTLPRFKASMDADLSAIFAGLGLKLAFSGDADFGGILGERAPKGSLTIGQIRHRAVIEVAEEGTEAAAASAVTGVRSIPLPEAAPVPFTVDRPFLFFVSDATTGSVLFQGRIADPSKAA
ncbi:MAG: serpin family protein [Rhodomicrobium sp.]